MKKKILFALIFSIFLLVAWLPEVHAVKKACLCTCGWFKSKDEYEYLGPIDNKFTRSDCSTECSDICSEENETIFYDTITEDLYTVFYNVNGGNVECSPNYVYAIKGKRMGEFPSPKSDESVKVAPYQLCVPSRNNYIFKGWFTLPSGGEEITNTYVPTGDMTLYAHWRPSVTCSRGTYLEPGKTSCKECLPGYYCEGGKFEIPTNSYQGITKCENFSRVYSSQTQTTTHSEKGAKSTNQCYFTCSAGTYFDGRKCAICPGNTYSKEHRIYIRKTNGLISATAENAKYVCNLKKPSGDGSSGQYETEPGSSSGASSGGEATGISLNIKEKTIKLGETFRINATITPRNAKNKTIGWSSSNPSVVGIDSSGMVIGKKVGSSLIIATINGHIATAKITVIDDTSSNQSDVVSKITIVPKVINLRVGAKQIFTYTVFPTGVSKDLIVWKSANPSVATIDSNGILTAKAVGSTRVIVMAKDGSAYDIANVIVSDVPIIITNNQGPNSSGIQTLAILVDPIKATININERFTLTIETVPSNATDKTFKWSSSDSSIASVDSNGIVTGKAYGVAEILAQTEDGKLQATSIITVADTSELLKNEETKLTIVDVVLSKKGFPILLIIIIIIIILLSIGIIIYSKKKKEEEKQKLSNRKDTNISG